jgi:hypothetical protein
MQSSLCFEFTVRRQQKFSRSTQRSHHRVGRIYRPFRTLLQSVLVGLTKTWTRKVKAMDVAALELGSEDTLTETSGNEEMDDEVREKLVGAIRSHLPVPRTAPSRHTSAYFSAPVIVSLPSGAPPSSFPLLVGSHLLMMDSITDFQTCFEECIAAFAGRASSASREALSKWWRYLRRHWSYVRSTKKTANHRSRDGGWYQK